MTRSTLTATSPLWTYRYCKRVKNKDQFSTGTWVGTQQHITGLQATHCDIWNGLVCVCAWLPSSGIALNQTCTISSTRSWLSRLSSRTRSSCGAAMWVTLHFLTVSERALSYSDSCSLIQEHFTVIWKEVHDVRSFICIQCISFTLLLLSRSHSAHMASSMTAINSRSPVCSAGKASALSAKNR